MNKSIYIPKWIIVFSNIQEKDTITSVCRRSKVSYTSTYIILKGLEKLKFISIDKNGRNNIIKIKNTELYDLCRNYRRFNIKEKEYGR